MLSAIEVNRLDKDGVYAVGGVRGLYLKIDGNSKSWVLRTTIAGKRRRMGLGSYPSVGLAQAREKARTARDLIDDGIDPIDKRKNDKYLLELKRHRAKTFNLASKEYIRTKEHEWRNEKHRAQWYQSLATYAYPYIGEMVVADISHEHILQILQPIWLEKTETAQRLRGRIESILDWAKVKKYRTGDNPARWRGHLELLLPAPSKFVKIRHHPAVPFKQIAQAFKIIQQVKGTSSLALQFLILTAARTGEVLGAEWPEIDLDNRVWTVPGTRMKGGRVHRVPLSSQAVNLLQSLPQEHSYIFANKAGKKLSNMSMITTMRRLQLKNETGVQAVPHGFRSSFRDWCAEVAQVPREVAEMALAHAIENKTEAAYRRGDLLDRRAELMQAWADYCLLIT